MGLWRGKVRSEALEMVASVHIVLPGPNEHGSWYGSGISKQSWESLSQSNLNETNIGTIRILKQIRDPSGLFAIEFKGVGAPQGSLAAEIKIQLRTSNLQGLPKEESSR